LNISYTLRIINYKDTRFPIIFIFSKGLVILMSFLSQSLFRILKQKILFVMPDILKLEVLKNSLAITFAVAMATFFVCDVNAIEASEKK
jgi:hypothetical protein